MIASFRELNPLKERLSGNIDKLLRFRTDDANRMGSGCIRMISFVDNTRIQADDIALLNAVAAGAVEVGGADVTVRFKEIDVDIDRAAHERGQRQFADGLAVLKVMIRALAVRAEVAGQIQRSVEIRDRSAGVVADQMAAAGFGLWVEHFREIDHAITIEFVYGFHDIVPP